MIASAALILGMQILLASSLQRETAAVLSARADAVLGTLSMDSSGRLAILERPVGELDRNSWVFTRDGRLIDGVLPTGALGSAISDLASTNAVALRTVSDCCWACFSSAVPG